MGKITQDEYLKISDLLHSENVKEIMQFMSVQYAGYRQEYCDHLLGLIPQIAQANVKRMADDLVLHRLAVNTLETMLPPNATYPFGNTGVVSYVYAECNFKRFWDESRGDFSHKRMVTASTLLSGSPGARATLPLFREYIDKCSEDPNWESDFMWSQLDNEDCKAMVRWCIENRDKWDDMQPYLDNLKRSTKKHG